MWLLCCANMNSFDVPHCQAQTTASRASGALCRVPRGNAHGRNLIFNCCVFFSFPHVYTFNIPQPPLVTQTLRGGSYRVFIKDRWTRLLHAKEKAKDEKKDEAQHSPTAPNIEVGEKIRGAALRKVRVLLESLHDRPLRTAIQPSSPPPGSRTKGFLHRP